MTFKLHCILTVPYGNHACSCGDVYNSYLYVIDNDGVDTEYGYRYQAQVKSCYKLCICVAFINLQLSDTKQTSSLVDHSYCLL